MSTHHLADYLDHILEAAQQACIYVEGLDKADFLEDRRTQQAVILNLVILGEAVTKLLSQYEPFAARYPQVPWRSMKGMRNRLAHGYSTSTLRWCGTPCRRPCLGCWRSCLRFGMQLLHPTTTTILAGSPITCTS